jgi:hypothetical protein
VDALTFCAEFFSQSVVIYFVTLAAFILATLRGRQRYLTAVLKEQHAGQIPKAAFEYRSRWSLFGLPLIHVRIGDRFDVVRGPVKAWFAVGSSHAVGVIFASGGLAVAPFSFGGIAIGVLSFGGISLGVFSLGAIAIGYWAYGAFCVGWQIFCGSGFALHAAEGGLVMARDYALGGVAHAAEANNQIASRFAQQDLFSRIARAINNHGFLMMLAWIVPMLLQARVVARARRREPTNS